MYNDVLHVAKYFAKSCKIKPCPKYTKTEPGFFQNRARVTWLRAAVITWAGPQSPCTAQLRRAKGLEPCFAASFSRPSGISSPRGGARKQICGALLGRRPWVWRRHLQPPPAPTAPSAFAKDEIEFRRIMRFSSDPSLDLSRGRGAWREGNKGDAG